MNKPLMYDLFCGAGGCTKGYQMAGFRVVGIDLFPQKNYCGDGFIQMDALEFLGRYLAGEYPEVDAFSASPPCQGYSLMRHVTGKEYPLMIPVVRRLLRLSGKPYIIENVESAPLIDATLLCGTMFGLKTFRHRKFETSFFMLAPQHITHTLFGRAAKQGRPTTPERQYITVTGHYSGVNVGRAAMGIDWTTKQELTQAIPPAYTHWIGERLIEQLSSGGAP